MTTLNFKNIAAKFFTLALIVTIAIPTSILARPFANDPEIKVYPDNEIINFGETQIGESKIEYFTIENTSDFSRTIQVSRVPNEPFFYEGSRELIVTPHSTRSLAVVFNPTNNGNFQSNLNILNTYTNESKSLTLKGQTAKEIETKRLKISKDNINFPQTILGETASTSIRLTNDNDFPMDLNVSIRAPFRIQESVPNVLLPKQELTLNVTFIPTEAEQYKGTLTINTNSREDRERSKTIELKGKGIEQFSNNSPELEIKSSNILDFGSVSRNSTNNKYIELKNNGNRTLDLRLIENSNSAFQIDFNNGNNETTLNTGQSKKIKVVFNPNNNGTFQTEFRLESNSYNIPYTTFTVRGTTNDYNSNNNTTTYYNNDNYKVSVSRQTINPDLNEIAYFNVSTPRSTYLNLEITDSRNNQNVYTQNYNSISAGTNNWQISWNGRNYAGNKVSIGKYKYSITTVNGKNTGYINVIRNKDHNSEDFVLYFDQNPFYNQYTVNDETLINELFVGPSILVAHNAYVYTSFMLDETAPVTANILDSEKRLIKTVKKNMPSNAGYKRNYIEWNTKINGQPAPDGQYYFEITAARVGKSDSDIVPFFIDRGPYYPELFEKQETEAPMGPVNNFYYQYNPKPSRPTQPTTSRPETNISCLDFIDVEGNTEFCDAVRLATEEQLFTGSINEAGDRTLRADDYITKAEATAIIVRLLGLTPSNYNPNLDGNLGFKDLDPTQWYMPYYKTISQLAIRETKNNTSQEWIKTMLRAYPDGTIRPTQPITRIQIYKLAIEAVKQSKNIKSNFTINYNPKGSSFADTKFSKANMKYLPYSNFIQNITNNTNFAQKYFARNVFSPNQAVTRAEFIEFIYQLQISKNIQF